MINPESILAHLKANLLPYKAISHFSSKPGIYAVGLHTNATLLKSAQNNVGSGDIIYIGKTQKSQVARDVSTHFASGKSGSSTLRRTLGAILREQLGLQPIPRSLTEKGNKRFTNYAFTAEGEERLNEWMRNNLSLSFWEYDNSMHRLSDIEESVIRLACPILNLSNNRANHWYHKIRALRDMCADLAEHYSSIDISPHNKTFAPEKPATNSFAVGSDLMKLHEAMVAVLKDQPFQAATPKEISQNIAQKELYRRPSDGGYAPPSQISARARQYPKLFSKLTDGRIQLKM